MGVSFFFMSLIALVEIEMARKRQRLLQFERDVDNAKLKFSKNLDGFKKMKERLKKYKGMQKKQMEEVDELKEKLSNIGVWEFGKVKAYQKFKGEVEEVETRLTVYKKNYKQKEDKGNNDVDELQKQNEILSIQIDHQEEIIKMQLVELEKMLEIEKEYQIWVQEENLRIAQEEAKLRRIELDRDHEMRSMMEELLDEESQVDTIERYINRKGDDTEPAEEELDVRF